MEFDLENPLTDFQSDHNNTTISSLFLSESDQHYFIPNNNNVTDFYINLRQETISYIVQCSSNLDPFVTYLAINYLDRFLSTHKFSKSKPWVCKLIAISCVTLAAKMKKTDYPEKLSQCYKLMQETNNYQSKFDKSSSLDTPVNVLDENFSSSQSDETTIISSSSSTTSVRNERW
ncbi:hypothetical protein ACFE04_018677 [Oxalis oulophora]